MQSRHFRTTHTAARFALFAALLLAFPASADDDAEKKPSAHPEAAEIFEEALDAMGGREALENVKSSSYKGTMTTPMGDVQVESRFAAPDRFLLTQVISGMGEIGMGSNGTTAWRRSPMAGYELLDPEEAKQIIGQTSMHAMLLRMEEEFETIETAGRETFKESDCYKVRLRNDDEENEQYVYFDIETKLMAGVEAHHTSPQGPITITVQFEDWKEHGDFKLFNRLITTQQGMEMKLQFDEMTFNSVDDAVFELPEEVKSLAQQRDEDSDEDKDDAEQTTETTAP